MSFAFLTFFSGTASYSLKVFLGLSLSIPELLLLLLGFSRGCGRRDCASFIIVLIKRRRGVSLGNYEKSFRDDILVMHFEGELIATFSTLPTCLVPPIRRDLSFFFASVFPSFSNFLLRESMIFISADRPRFSGMALITDLTGLIDSVSVFCVCVSS